MVTKFKSLSPDQQALVLWGAEYLRLNDIGSASVTLDATLRLRVRRKLKYRIRLPAHKDEFVACFTINPHSHAAKVGIIIENGVIQLQILMSDGKVCIGGGNPIEVGQGPVTLRVETRGWYAKVVVNDTLSIWPKGLPASQKTRIGLYCRRRTDVSITLPVLRQPKATEVKLINRVIARVGSECRVAYTRAALSVRKGIRKVQAKLLPRQRAATTVLLFADTNVSVSNLIRLIEREAKQNNVICICASYATEVKVREIVSSDLLLSPRVSIVEVIPTDADPEGRGYLYARVIAYSISDLLLTHFTKRGQAARHAEILDSFKDYLADRMQRAIRPAIIFLQLLKSGSVQRATLLSEGASVMKHFADSLLSEGSVRVPITVKLTGTSDVNENRRTKQEEVAARFTALRGGGSRNILMTPAKSCDIVVLTVMRNDVYRKALTPVIRELSKGYSVRVLIFATPPHRRNEFAREIQDLGAEVDFFIAEHRPPPSAEVIDAFHECANELLSHVRNNLVSCPSSIADYALLTCAPHALRCYGYAEAVWDVAEEQCRAGFACLIVSPGRLIEPRIFVRRARAWGIKSIDMQLGTISSERKFLPAIADRVLAQDPAGFNLLREHFQIDESRLVLTGTPKTDELIKTYSSLTKEQARAKLRLSIGADEPLLLFTSQPFSDATMGEVFALVCAAGVKTIVKLHPSETENREALYRSIIERMDAVDRVTIVREGNTFEYIRAADVVATYCSGTGIEAFQLDRPTLMVDPFEHPPSVDLQLLGVAHRVRTANEIADLTYSEKREPGAIAALLNDPIILKRRELTRTISDGNAMDRILNEVKRIYSERMAHPPNLNISQSQLLHVCDGRK